ncbi:hypothetical protein Ciccas_003895, partial [Cichlidogyrus casuarinus]
MNALDSNFYALLFFFAYTSSHVGYGNLRAPCAWLESGGFFSNPELNPSLQALIQPRSLCPSKVQRCPMKWLPLDDLKAITFKLAGTDDMQDYDYQMQFCDVVYTYQHRICTGTNSEIAYELHQRKAWLFLERIYCRCLKVTHPESYDYTRPIFPTDESFSVQKMSMHCGSL